jgi:hypothetical protein
MNMAKLYQLSINYQKLMEMMDNAITSEEGIPEDDLEMYKDTLDSVKDSIENKCENIIKFMKNINSDIAGLKAEEERLAKQRKYMENKHDGLKKYMEEALRSAGIKNLQLNNFKIRFQKNPASVEVLDIKKIPSEFLTEQEPKVDKTGILKSLKDGKEIQGVKLVTDKDHIRIV